MIVTRTPYRISFFGGGTDYPVYYKEHGGACLSTTINKYCYITCRYLPPFFEHKYLIRYSKNELANSVDEIKHPSVKACLGFMGIEDGVEIVHAGDIPARSGTGSSSSFTVGLLHALYALQGKMVTKRSLALDAIYIEQEVIGESVGSQDQVAAAFGGLNKIEFGGVKDGLFVQQVPMDDEKIAYLQDCMLFYFTGSSRYSSDFAKEQISNAPEKTRELRIMRQMVDEALAILGGKKEQLNEFGKLLHESWMFKKSLASSISNDRINEIYDIAMKAGALGGKICGAGGGGFVLLFVPPENKKRVQDKLKNLLLVPFRFENLGSHLIFYSTT
jgi:D-glycero-alpha-D-manno-heptose-7-phosphate kinase